VVSPTAGADVTLEREMGILGGNLPEASEGWQFTSLNRKVSTGRGTSREKETLV